MPVFEGRFRVAEDITIAPEAQVKPALSRPATWWWREPSAIRPATRRSATRRRMVPLRWTLHYEALDRQRVPAEMQRKAPAGPR